VQKRTWRILQGGEIMKKMWSIGLAVLVMLSVSGTAMSAEANFPTKPIEIIVGMAPGGGGDVEARMLAETSKQLLGQNIIVENKPGAMNMVAYSLVKNAKPDGYTLGLGSDVAITLAPHQQKMPWTGPEDFTFIAQVGTLTNGLVVLPDSPLRTVKDMVEFARANPGKLSIATLGKGGAGHLSMEGLARRENLKISLVPFPGAAPCTTALLGGHVMMVAAGFSGYNHLLKAKKVRLLAMQKESRMDEYPDVPTLKESGYGNLVADVYHVVIGPKNMDKGVISKLAAAFKKGMENPAYVKANTDIAMHDSNFVFEDKLAAFMAQAYQQNGALIKELGMGVK
jgi:tripartite-type tricarboxylate transporter receptor subunit TctC